MRTKFDEQLEQLNVALITTGALCEDAISTAAKALLENDMELAKKVKPIELEIDQKEREIENLCMRLLLQQQPVAGDLRQISSALKMITGVTFPTKGEVIVNGTVSALLELTAGFDMALTGRENIHLRGHAMGLDADEIAALEPKVVEFADLGVYIDQPVRTYSSGMKSRLGFAFAVSSDPEILVVDEALSVGDKQFQQKCFARVREIMEDEDVTIHSLRHTYASFAIAQGADVKTLQMQLGHSSPSITLNTYTALWPERLDDVADAIGVLRERELV